LRGLATPRRINAAGTRWNLQRSARITTSHKLICSLSKDNVLKYSHNKRLLRAWLLGASFAACLAACPGGAVAEQITETPAVADGSAIAVDAGLDLVKHHLYDNLSVETLANFNLFVYVDKAQEGSLAQRMYVFEKTDSGDLAMIHDWPVSTGRESDETDPHGRAQSTVTPRGFFELDPKRMYVDHVSSQWDEAMPYAMFFSWKPGGHDTGLAIHGTPEGNYTALGSRASAGCIRLSLENAHTLFDLVQSRFHSPTPKLAYLDGDRQVSSEGLLLHEPDGKLKMTDGYSVLVLVDEYVPEQRVSALY
jgi:lipoprotein-anchoring transpeptidase ErfK/SrfK